MLDLPVYYERATELLVRYGIDLEDRIVSDQQRGTLTGEPAYRLYLDDLLAIYTELLGQYRGVGNCTDFVTRLRRYAGLILQQEKN